jgi:hypothetical protein
MDQGVYQAAGICRPRTEQGTFDAANTLTTQYLLTLNGDENPVNRIKPLFLAWLTALLLGLIISGPSLADGDGGDGGDGGGDDGGMDDGGEDPDDGDPGDGMGHDGRGHHGGHHGHHGHHGGHHHTHVIYGGWGPGFYPGYGFGAFGYFPPYYAPFYGYPRVAVQPTAPPVYIEQQNPPAAPAASASTSQPGARYWHYCQGEGGYYPDVKECPEGWVQVAPQTQSASPEQQ